MDYIFLVVELTDHNDNKEIDMAAALNVSAHSFADFCLSELQKTQCVANARVNLAPRANKGLNCHAIVPGVTLSPQETLCLNHLMQKKTYKQVGQQLGLSHRTVEFYVNNIRRKLKCRSKKELLRMFIAAAPKLQLQFNVCSCVLLL